MPHPARVFAPLPLLPLPTHTWQIHFALLADKLHHRAGMQSGSGLGSNVGTAEPIQSRVAVRSLDRSHRFGRCIRTLFAAGYATLRQ